MVIGPNHPQIRAADERIRQHESLQKAVSWGSIASLCLTAVGATCLVLTTRKIGPFANISPWVGICTISTSLFVCMAVASQASVRSHGDLETELQERSGLEERIAADQARQAQWTDLQQQLIQALIAKVPAARGPNRHLQIQAAITQHRQQIQATDGWHSQMRALELLQRWAHRPYPHDPQQAQNEITQMRGELTALTPGDT